MQLIKNSIRIELVNLGEGLSGDYDPTNPEDVNLLRFDVSRKVGRRWEEIPDASYCTQIPAYANTQTKRKVLQILMRDIYPPASRGHSIKKLCERLSWIASARRPQS